MLYWFLFNIHVNHEWTFFIWTVLLINSFVGFYGISTIVGYLMPNPLNIYIYIYIFLNDAKLLFCIMLNGFKYCYVSLIIPLCVRQLKDKTVLFQAIQLSNSHLFAHSLVQAFLFDLSTRPYQVLPLRASVDLEVLAMMGYSIFHLIPALLIWFLFFIGISTFICYLMPKPSF